MTEEGSNCCQTSRRRQQGDGGFGVGQMVCILRMGAWYERDSEGWGHNDGGWAWCSMEDGGTRHNMDDGDTWWKMGAIA